MGALLRHPAAVIGIAMGYLVLVEGVFVQALQGAQPWLLRLNVDGWLQHGTKYAINSCTTDGLGNYTCKGIDKVLTVGHRSASGSAGPFRRWPGRVGVPMSRRQLSWFMTPDAMSSRWSRSCRSST